MARPDFPRSLPEFARRFQTEEDCFEYILASRWPDQFACPHCNSPKTPFRRGDRLAVQCVECDRITTATSGTVVHRSRQPLHYWLLAAFLSPFEP